MKTQLILPYIEGVINSLNYLRWEVIVAFGNSRPGFVFSPKVWGREVILETRAVYNPPNSTP